ncbi:AsnC family transcriptional regulator [Candidatus Woesearchaeota archaeon]|nr:AsnC family transcriptional regulator [Candidatus Woesearchaeota archaeon]
MVERSGFGKVYSLDIIDRKILLELDKNCRKSDAQISKIVGRSRESVKYRIAQLEKKGIIDGYLTTINPNKIGYHLFKIFLQVENIEEEKRKLIDYLKNNESVYWMGLSEGNWDMVFATNAKNQVEFYDIKNDLLTKFNHIIIKMATGELVDVTQYLKNYLLPDQFQEVKDWDRSILWGNITVDNTLDKTDSLILKILSNNARIPITQIASKTETTASIVRTKIKNLENLDIIQAYRISININKLGLEFFKAIIYFKQLPPKRMTALYEYVKLHPKIIYFLRTFTPWELELEFVVESYLEFNEIISGIRSEFSDIIKNYELIIMYEEAWFPAYKKMFD